MNNIRIDVSLEKLNVPYSSNVDIVLLEYKSNDITAFASLFNGERTDKIEIDLEKFSNLLSFLTQLNFSVGTDRKNLFINHREIRYIRFILPEGLAQIDYLDESVNISFDSQLSEAMRTLWKVSKSTN